MHRKVLSWLTVAVLSLVIAGCDNPEDNVTIGAKNFSESRILSEMILALLEEQGIPTNGIVDYPTTQSVLEATKNGAVDIYPEYNGTGLVMLGQNPLTDGDEATARVKDLYEPLGLTWLERFGFANNYGLAVRSETAAELGLTRISQLVPVAGDLTIATEDDFLTRPLDGYDAMLQRYGMEFGTIEEVPLDDRQRVFDLLIEDDADVAVVYTTDGQIDEYGLTLLEDDLAFFPIYQAAPVARADALSRYPGMGPTLAVLAGKISPELMREMNARVDLEGRVPQAVARDALARMDLIEAGAVEAQEPLLVAAEPGMAEGTGTTVIMRAVQRAFTGRATSVEPAADPLAAVASGEARLALVGADAFYDISTPNPTQRGGFEAVAAAGQVLLHVIAPEGGPADLGSAARIVTGPAGTASERIARILVEGLGLDAELVPVEGGTEPMLAALSNGQGDAAVVMAAEGDGAIAAAMAGGGLRLLPLRGWGEGANMVRFPFLREARIPQGTYQSQIATIDTLRSQLVLAGPAPVAGDAVGDQGPGAVASTVQPVTEESILALNEALPGNVGVDPVLPVAASLAPEMPQPAAALNPSAGLSILSLIICGFFVWLVWLLIRPEHR